MEKTKITISAKVNAPVDQVWKCWTTPADIMAWNSASEDWHTPKAENDLRVGGSFSSRMESRDGKYGFDFGGIYDAVTTNKHIAYTIGDGRTVQVDFEDHGDTTSVTETFEAEGQNPVEMQRDGWQAILNNFKQYAENQ